MREIIILLFIAFSLLSCSRETATEPVDDGVPPLAPLQLRVTYAADGEVVIEWDRNKEAGIKGYNIYRTTSDSTKPVYLSFSTDNYFYDSNLDYDTIYYYTVSALDIFGMESKLSQTVSAKPENKYYPYPPKQPGINAQNWLDTLRINLSWYPPIDTDIAGYEIYRNTIADFEVDSLNLHGFTSSNVYKDTSNLELLTEYFYKIVAVDRGGLKSNSSPEVSDLIHDRPKFIKVEENTDKDYGVLISFTTVGTEADYEILIQKNELFDIVYRYKFSESAIHAAVSRTIDWNSFELYKKYYIRIVSYSKGKDEPNSFSDLYSFTLHQ